MWIPLVYRLETWQHHVIAHEALDKTSVAGHARADIADGLSDGLIGVADSNDRDRVEDWCSLDRSMEEGRIWKRCVSIPRTQTIFDILFAPFAVVSTGNVRGERRGARLHRTVAAARRTQGRRTP